MARLMELDTDLARERKILDSKSMQVNQLEAERLERSEERNALETELKDFEEKNRDVVTRDTKGGKGLADLKRIYAEQIQSITRQRDEERERGKKTDLKYRMAKKKLEQQYLDAREKFVPDFNSLAKLFLGPSRSLFLRTVPEPRCILIRQKAAWTSLTKHRRDR